MKVALNRKQFAEALGIVAGAAPQRTPMPVLESARLEVGADGASITATDLEVAITVRVLGAEVDRPGVAMLPIARIRQVFASSEAEQLVVEADGPSIHVRGAKERFRLASFDPDTFPAVPGFDSPDYLVVGEGDLKRAIRRTAFATDTNGTRMNLGGVFHDLGHAPPTFVATDGNVMALQTAEVTRVGDPDREFPPQVVPCKALKILERAAEEGSPRPVHIVMDGRSVRYRTELFTLTTRTLEGRFTEWKKHLLWPVEHRVAISPGEFESAARGALIMTSEETRRTTLAFSEHLLTLSVRSPDSGEARIEVATDYDGPATSFDVDIRYFSEALKQIPEGTPTTLGLGADNPLVPLGTADGYTYLVAKMSPLGQ